MRTEEIMNSLGICARAGGCAGCDYADKVYSKGCVVKLKNDAALRLEELCDRIEEKEKRIDEQKKTIHELVGRINELKERKDNSAGLWVSVNDRLPDKELAKCLVFLYGEVCFSYFHRGEFHNPDVTHWMEIPEPPKKTYKDVFLKAFPNCLIGLIQERNCVNYFFPQFNAGEVYCGDCESCWNKTYEEEGEAE